MPVSGSKLPVGMGGGGIERSSGLREDESWVSTGIGGGLKEGSGGSGVSSSGTSASSTG